VVLLDGDLGLGNINVMLGFKPQKDLSSVIDGACDIKDAIIRGPWGISILPSGSGYQDMADLNEEGRGRIISALHELPQYADVLVIDTGAGIGASVLSLTLIADIIAVAITPDVTSMTDAYSLIKVISQRPTDAQFKLIVNRARSTKEAKGVAAKLCSVAKKFLDHNISFLGIISEDRDVQSALVDRKPLLLTHPRSTASMQLRTIADLLTKELRQKEAQVKSSNLDERVGKVVSKL
jgi:flagellar biosynthesis protein FlhG